MESSPEEVMGSNDLSIIVKGKRTKRQRALSPLPIPIIPPSSLSGGGEGEGHGSSSGVGGGDGGGGDGGDGGDDSNNFPSPTSSREFTESTEEEEDMANCLILLAQGHGRLISRRVEEGSSRRFAEAATTTTAKAGFYVYECKTCNRCFPSFQALGGHRASHKRPKPEEKKSLMGLSLEEEEGQFNNSSPSLNLQMGNKALYSNNKSRIHECSICGSEFSSGQALGGHMRRHRSTTTAAATTTTMTVMPTTTSESEEAKARNMLSLDLNLPAPPEDDHHRETQFSFASNPQPPLLFSASALVDCHY